MVNSVNVIFHFASKWNTTNIEINYQNMVKFDLNCLSKNNTFVDNYCNNSEHNH